MTARRESARDGWAVVPAAGAGRRMAADVPKQYLQIHGRPIIEHSLERLLGHPRIRKAVVALSHDDTRWSSTACAGLADVVVVQGGAERCHSVLNSLDYLSSIADPQDWVLVHDAARPCLRAGDIDRLFEGLAGHPVGGLLAVPVHDTMKRADAVGDVVETVSRDGLWHAYTPQMFRLGALRAALQAAVDAGVLPTDEAAAMERLGHRPRLVEGRADNIKVTRPGDLALAEFFISQQES